MRLGDCGSLWFKTGTDMWANGLVDRQTNLSIGRLPLKTNSTSN